MNKILFFLLPTLLFATPAQVILIRHGEKPESGYSLNLKGRERAAALVPFFHGTPSVLTYGMPVAIYAPKPGLEDPSLRAMQTVLPLTEEMRLPLQNDFTYDQVQSLATEILENPDYEGKMVLIAWGHTGIPTIASLLGAKKAPKKWPKNTFDRLWILTFNDDGKVAFENLPQKLLYGDASK